MGVSENCQRSAHALVWRFLEVGCAPDPLSMDTVGPLEGCQRSNHTHAHASVLRSGHASPVTSLLTVWLTLRWQGSPGVHPLKSFGDGIGNAPNDSE